MTTYIYEVAPWCPSNWHEPEHIEVVAASAFVEELAIAVAVDEHLPKDRDTWSQLPDEMARAAWDDDRTVAAFNVTGPRGTYQTRLARAETTDHMVGSAE